MKINERREMRNIEEKEFNSLIRKNIPVIIEFGTEGCGPCKKIKPILEELEKELEGKAEIYFFDIGKSQAKAIEYEVLSIPQILIFKDGNLLEKIFGEQKKENLRKIVENYIK